MSPIVIGLALGGVISLAVPALSALSGYLFGVEALVRLARFPVLGFWAELGVMLRALRASRWLRARLAAEAERRGLKGGA